MSIKKNVIAMEPSMKFNLKSAQRRDYNQEFSALSIDNGITRESDLFEYSRLIDANLITNFSASDVLTGYPTIFLK